MKKTFATVEFAGNDFFIGTTPSGHSQVMDLNHERDSATSPFELVQVALGGCTGGDVMAILRNKHHQRVTAYRVEVETKRRDTPPRSYSHIEVRHIVRGYDISPEAVQHAVELSTNKYCGVINSLRPTAEVVATWTIEQEPTA